MLVLTRRLREQIVIGDDNKIVITILHIQGDKVSLGIEADKKIYPVYRKELLDEGELQAKFSKETCHINLSSNSTEELV